MLKCYCCGDRELLGRRSAGSGFDFAKEAPPRKNDAQGREGRLLLKRRLTRCSAPEAGLQWGVERTACSGGLETGSGKVEGGSSVILVDGAVVLSGRLVDLIVEES